MLPRFRGRLSWRRVRRFVRIRRRTRQHLTQKPEGHDSGQHGAVALVSYFQTIEEGFYIGIGAVASHGGFGRAGQSDEDIHFIGDGARFVGRLSEGFGAEVNRVNSQVKRAKVAS